MFRAPFRALRSQVSRTPPLREVRPEGILSQHASQETNPHLFYTQNVTTLGPNIAAVTSDNYLLK
jgi:hypothetical protein